MEGVEGVGRSLGLWWVGWELGGGGRWKVEGEEGEEGEEGGRWKVVEGEEGSGGR